MRISAAAFDLIVVEEVSSEKIYTKKYQRPEWPGESSGVTVGIGYDLGQTPRDKIIADWKDHVDPGMLGAMVSASGVTGKKAEALTRKLHNLILIPWDKAIAVHKESVLPRWEDTTSNALPNTDKLSPDSFGALVSLTFNRGPSFRSSGGRYSEMRNIRKHMQALEFEKIPGEFRDMKRLWPSSAGLRRRRDTEAKMFERGLNGAQAAEGGSRALWMVQSDLIDLGYRPGTLDGAWGGMTAGAISGFLTDRQSKIKPPTSLSQFNSVAKALQAEISQAKVEGFKRPIALERSQAPTEKIGEKVPEVASAGTAERVGFWASIVGAVGTTLTGIAKVAGDVVEMLEPVKAFVGEVPWQVWGVAVFGLSIALYYVSRKSGEAKNAAADAFREGART
jgi:hypothetical protein